MHSLTNTPLQYWHAQHPLHAFPNVLILPLRIQTLNNAPLIQPNTCNAPLVRPYKYECSPLCIQTLNNTRAAKRLQCPLGAFIHRLMLPMCIQTLTNSHLKHTSHCSPCAFKHYHCYSQALKCSLCIQLTMVPLCTETPRLPVSIQTLNNAPHEHSNNNAPFKHPNTS